MTRPPAELTWRQRRGTAPALDSSTAGSLTEEGRPCPDGSSGPARPDRRPRPVPRRGSRHRPPRALHRGHGHAGLCRELRHVPQHRDGRGVPPFGQVPAAARRADQRADVAVLDDVHGADLRPESRGEGDRRAGGRHRSRAVGHRARACVRSRLLLFCPLSCVVAPAAAHRSRTPSACSSSSSSSWTAARASRSRGMRRSWIARSRRRVADLGVDAAQRRRRRRRAGRPRRARPGRHDTACDQRRVGRRRRPGAGSPGGQDGRPGVAARPSTTVQLTSTAAAARPGSAVPSARCPPSSAARSSQVVRLRAAAAPGGGGALGAQAVTAAARAAGAAACSSSSSAPALGGGQPVHAARSGRPGPAAPRARSRRPAAADVAGRRAARREHGQLLPRQHGGTRARPGRGCRRGCARSSRRWSTRSRSNAVVERRGSAGRSATQRRRADQLGQLPDLPGPGQRGEQLGGEVEVVRRGCGPGRRRCASAGTARTAGRPAGRRRGRAPRADSTIWPSVM